MNYLNSIIDLNGIILTRHYENNYFSYSLIIGEDHYQLNGFPTIETLDENNFVLCDKSSKKSVIYLINTKDKPVLDLLFTSKETYPFTISNNLLKHRTIIIKPNLKYLYSFEYGVVISSGFDEIKELDSDTLLVTKSTFHENYEGLLDYDGHLINEELYSPKLNKRFAVNEHNLEKSITDLDKKIILYKRADCHDYLDDQAHLYKRIKTK